MDSTIDLFRVNLARLRQGPLFPNPKWQKTSRSVRRPEWHTPLLFHSPLIRDTQLKK